MEENQQTTSSVDVGEFLGRSSYAASSREDGCSDSTYHTPRYAPDRPWNSSDNNPPTPIPAFLDDPETDPQGYHTEPTSRYDLQDTVRQDAGSTGFEASPIPTTPMGALDTPPQGYEWHISSTYEAYLVPLPGTASTSAHANSTSTGISMALAPYGLPTPPEEMVNYSHSRVNRGRSGLPEWLSGDLERKLVDVLDERDQIWARKRGSPDFE